jgi:flagellar assembly factor FliW
MNVVECIEPPAVAAKPENPIRLPHGLFGFEQIQDFVLLSNPGEEPFQWLQVKDDANLAFLVLSPFAVMPNYLPELPENEIAFLNLKGPEDAVMLNIVTMRGASDATINLKGPIVLNRHTLVGKQVIPTNAAQFSVQYPLPTATE